MTPAARERSQTRVPVLFISAAAWILLLAAPGGTVLSAHCPPGMQGMKLSAASIGAFLTMNPPARLAAAWALMLIAMMAPALIAPVRHVRDRSFACRRVRAVGLFVAGYFTIWMTAGAILMTVAWIGSAAAPRSSTPLIAATIAAVLWQFSPDKQRCLNRRHAHPELAAFDRAADIDALRFGLTHGVWCVGSCWALMLWPLLVSRGHLAAMAAVTLWILGEQFARPSAPCWCLRIPDKAIRLAVAQMRMRLVAA
jgi:predicted metal-binding membrane protein